MADPLPFQAVFYINLDRRADRLEQIEAELDRLGLRHIAERIPGIPTSPGIVGCGQSHLKALRLARERGLTSVLILEDDFECLVSPEEVRANLAALAASQEQFDVVMLAYNPEAKRPHSDLLFKIDSTATASAYIVHERFYDQLISLYEWALPRLIETGLHWEYANDQIWKRLQPGSAWYGFTTRLGRQRASFSDTANTFSDYRV